MATPIRILLQTTIPIVDDDWTIDRFSLLAKYLRSIRDESGAQVYEVTTRNRDANAQGADVQGVTSFFPPFRWRSHRTSLRAPLA